MNRLDLEVADSAWDRLHDLTLFWEKFHSDERIGALADELLNEAEWLCSHPRAGAFETQMPGSRYQYRHWVVGHVKIVYRVTRSAIRVSDFFDSRQDPRRMKG
ncbi:MAG: hypothetical protein KA175_02555 [Flavobacteriales bacterium]|nr:hypothetical protein [Flavobacteriales bacterium]MBP6696470.1 hypothetical protein [Flavobacteriales bacterium]